MQCKHDKTYSKDLFNFGKSDNQQKAKRTFKVAKKFNLLFGTSEKQSIVMNLNTAIMEVNWLLM